MTLISKHFPASLCVFLLAIFALPTVSFSQEVSLDDIMESHFKALGGEEAVAKVDNYESHATVTMKGAFGNMSGTAQEVIDVKGKRYFSDLDLGQYRKTEAMVGDTGWSKGTDGDHQMDSQTIAFAKMSLGVSPLVSAYEAAKGALKVKGTKEFNNEQCHVVAVGSGVEYFVGTESGLLEGMKVANVRSITTSNYKAVDGVQFPMTQSMTIDAAGVSLDYQFRDMKVNVPIDDDLFGGPSETERASKPAYSAEDIMSFLDKDGDEKISKAEAQASSELAPAFGLVDANNDDFIDFKETQSMVDYLKKQGASQSGNKKEPREKVTSNQIIESMDKNKDGKISNNEANEDLKLFFTEFDVNKDGFIDAEEGKMVAAEANKRQ